MQIGTSCVMRCKVGTGWLLYYIVEHSICSPNITKHNRHNAYCDTNWTIEPTPRDRYVHCYVKLTNNKISHQITIAKDDLENA